MSSARLLAIAFAIAFLSDAATARAADIVRGAEVYRQHCANCHGPTGSSVWPGAPNLSRREAPLRTDQALLQILRTGRGAKPAFQGMVSDADILNVIAYSRTLAR